MKTLARRSLQSAFSIGPGYESQPVGAFIDVERVRGYFIDFRAKTTSVSAAQPELLVPAGLAQLALGWWERHLAGDAEARERFFAISEQLAARGRRDDDVLLWSYDMPLPKYGLAAPWHSALAQGQAASVFVRAHLESGSDRFAELAGAAIAPVLPPGQAGLLVSTADGPVPEEAPSTPPSLILNGWIYALWGLWDVATGLDSTVANQLYEESVACLTRTLPQYDVGWWSRYSLYPHPLPDLAKPFYHRLHIDQLDALYRLTGSDAFRAMSERFARYDTVLGRTRALTQKARFVASR